MIESKSIEQDIIYEVVLEIKSNGSRLTNVWPSFKFILKKQEFSPYTIDDTTKPRGCLKIANSKAFKTDEFITQGKLYTFKVISENDQYIFNARNESIREKTISLLNFSARNPDWYDPYDIPSYVILRNNEVSQVLYNNLYSNSAIEKILNILRRNRAKKLKYQLESLHPELYVISVNKTINIDTVANGNVASDVVAYVSGLAMNKETEDIFNGKHTETTTICMTKTPVIVADQSTHATLVASDTTLSFISFSIVHSKQRHSQVPLGIAFVPFSDIPRRTSSSEYKVYTSEVKLEPFLTPDLTNLTKSLKSSSSTKQQGDSAINDERDEDGMSYISTTVDENVSPVVTLSNRAAIEREVSGSISITIHTPDPLYSMCGWLNKKSGNILNGSDTFKSYWFVLMHGEISYYSQAVSPGSGNISMENPKKVISCKDVTAIELVNRKFISIQFTLPGSLQSYEWQLKLVNPQTGKTTTEIAANGRMWLRKLMRCCPQVIDPTLELASKAGFVIERKLRSIEMDQERILLKNRKAKRKPSSLFGDRSTIRK